MYQMKLYILELVLLIVPLEIYRAARISRTYCPTKDQPVQPQTSWNYEQTQRRYRTAKVLVQRRTRLSSTSEAALYSPEDSMQGPDLVCDLEQLEYQYRLMTSGEEEIMKIYEAGWHLLSSRHD